MDDKDKELLYQALIRAVEQKLLLKKVKELADSETKKKPAGDDVLNNALSRQRRLPGAKLIRSARPMTDFLVKAKKKARRAVNSGYFKYRGSVKSPQKALINESRKKAKSAYKRK